MQAQCPVRGAEAGGGSLVGKEMEALKVELEANEQIN